MPMSARIPIMHNTLFVLDERPLVEATRRRMAISCGLHLEKAGTVEHTHDEIKNELAGDPVLCQRSVYAMDSIQPRYKNKTEILSNQLIQQGIAPKNAVYVGDSEGDRIAAEENSLYFIRADWGYEMENSRLDPA